MNPPARHRPIFPKWVDSLRPVVAAVVVFVPLYALTLAYFGGSPRTTDVGYQPEQPVPYSHALHAGQLGLDCRYCHATVERAAVAALPPTATCMNCHAAIWPDSAKLEVVRESHRSGMPIPWVRVHDLPDYAYFDHGAHLRAGVGCVDCHGRVDKMEVVYQAQPLTMGWCLDCHRNPQPHLRPASEITNMSWTPPAAAGAEPAAPAAPWVSPSEDCSRCHR